jgi:hypothetical protein
MQPHFTELDLTDEDEHSAQEYCAGCQQLFPIDQLTKNGKKWWCAECWPAEQERLATQRAERKAKTEDTEEYHLDEVNALGTFETELAQVRADVTALTTSVNGLLQGRPAPITFPSVMDLKHALITKYHMESVPDTELRSVRYKRLLMKQYHLPEDEWKLLNRIVKEGMMFERFLSVAKTL